MSWLYLPEQGVESWGESSQDSELSVMSNGKRHAKKLSRQESGKGSLTTPQSGMMRRHLTESPGVESWILLLQDSRVNHSHLQAKGWERMIRGICGRIPFASLKKQDQNGVSWKMSQPSLGLISDKFLLTWPKSGMILDGHAYRLPLLERLTVEKGSGLFPTVNLFPTPMAMDDGKRHSGYGFLSKKILYPTATASDQIPRKGFGFFKYRGIDLATAAKIFPTPTVFGCQIDQSKSRKISSNHMSGISKDGRKWGTTLLTTVKLMQNYPTPRASNPSKGSPSYGETFQEKVKNYEGINHSLKEGRLNPDWVEWLMGWPIGWTNSKKPLTEKKYKKWEKDILSGEWWNKEPEKILRITKNKNISLITSQLKAIGNGQVSIVAYVIWALFVTDEDVINLFTKNQRNKVIKTIRRKLNE